MWIFSVVLVRFINDLKLILVELLVAKAWLYCRQSARSPVLALDDNFSQLSGEVLSFFWYSTHASGVAALKQQQSVVIIASHQHYQFCLCLNDRGVGVNYCSWPCSLIIASSFFVHACACVVQCCIRANFVVCRASSSWWVFKAVRRPCGYHWRLSRVVFNPSRPSVISSLLQLFKRLLWRRVHVINVVLCRYERFRCGCFRAVEHFDLFIIDFPALVADWKFSFLSPWTPVDAFASR